MKKLLLEFYKELLPVFEKYGGVIEAEVYGGDEYRNFAIYVKNQADSMPGGYTQFNAHVLKDRVKELEDETTTTD